MRVCRGRDTCTRESRITFPAQLKQPLTGKHKSLTYTAAELEMRMLTHRLGKACEALHSMTFAIPWPETLALMQAKVNDFLWRILQMPEASCAALRCARPRKH